MVYKRFRLQAVFRVLLLLASALLLGYLILETRYYEVWIFLGLLVLYQIVALVRYVEKHVRDVARFLESVRSSDFSQHFRAKGRGPLFERLVEGFEEVNAEFRQLRAEREERARYLQNVVRHVGVALLAYRADGEVELINDAAHRLFDVRRLPAVQELRAFSKPLAEKLLEAESGARALVNVRRGGHDLQLAVYTTRFQIRGRDYALASIQDIRSELEEQEMEAWQQLTRVLTHEIMNSVAPISSLTNRLIEANGESGEEGGVPEEKSQRAAQAIQRRSEALMDFVDSFRSFTKLPTPEFELVAAEKLLGRVRQLLSAQIEEKRLGFQLSVDPSHMKLIADPKLVEQILINLLLNAIQAVEDQPDAQIELSAYIDRHSRPAIEVSDNGPGIPPDVQEKIFVPFFTTKEEGSGIGLSLARQIMRLHDGMLTMHSEPGSGATFMLRF
jgi:nitrogen fixation/metabolism regulation signal transduction histidine kinase